MLLSCICGGMFLSVLDKTEKEFIVLDEAQFPPGDGFDVILIVAHSVDLLKKLSVFILQTIDSFQVILSFLFHPVEVDKAPFPETKPSREEAQEEQG